MSRFFSTAALLLAHMATLAPNVLAEPITQGEFEAIIKKVDAYYQPIAALHQQTLSISAEWDNPEPNAHSQQDEGGTNWKTILYGGLARRKEMTADGFTLVVCHEIGHHLAGYPMYVGDWGMINSLASEGQADYYAAQACLRGLWKDEDNTVDGTGVPPSVSEKCAANWKDAAERQLCERIVLAGKSAADTWAASEGVTVSLDTTDPEVATQTNHNYYPSAQCRLDTYVAGALCRVHFDDRVIPGRLHPDGQESDGAFEQAMLQSCRDGDGMRPACWFRSSRDYSPTLFKRNTFFTLPSSPRMSSLTTD